MRGSGKLLVCCLYDPYYALSQVRSVPVRAVPGRHVRSVHDHTQRLYEPYCDRGNWTDEEDLRLMR